MDRDFQYEEPEKDDDDRMHDALSDLAALDTYDTDLRDHPKAYEVLDRIMKHAYAEGRKDEREALSEPIHAKAIYRVKSEADRDGLDLVGFVWRLQKAWVAGS